MSSRYRYYHTCGHIGFGLGLHVTPHHMQASEECSRSATIPATLDFSCPFCSAPKTSDVREGEGILVLLYSSMVPPATNYWQVLRSCSREDITSEEWSSARQLARDYQHMAWVPQPCGVVELGTVEEGILNGRVGFTTSVSTSWRQQRGEGARSRFAGLLSQMDAALWYGEYAGR